jgi:hypothetical protein
MPCSHVSLPVPFSKADAEAAFLLAAFGHMGLKEIARPGPGVVGLGENAPWLWISGLQRREPIDDDTRILQVHLALTATGTFLFDRS